MRGAGRGRAIGRSPSPAAGPTLDAAAFRPLCIAAEMPSVPSADRTADRSESRDRHRRPTADRSESRERHRRPTADRSESRERHRRPTDDRSDSHDRHRRPTADRSDSRDRHRRPTADRSDSRERHRRPTADRSESRDRHRRPTTEDTSTSAERHRRPTTEDTSTSAERHRRPTADRSESRERHRRPTTDDTSTSADRHRRPTADRSESRERHAADVGSSSGSGSSASRKRPAVRYATPQEAPALAARGSLSGFLRKQADNEPGAWHRYFFVLKPLTYLFYYNAPEDEAPRGVLDLEFLADVKRNGDCLQRAVGGSEHCFRVSGKLPAAVKDKMRPLYLDAESAADAQQWMTALQQHRFSLDRHEQMLASVQQLQETEARATRLAAEKDKRENEARTMAVLADRVLSRLRRLALSNEDPTVEPPEPLEPDEDEDGARVDVLGSLQAMESVVGELQSKVATQQQELARLREQLAEHERKQREKALKFVAASFKNMAANRQNRSLTTAKSAAPAVSDDEMDGSASSSTTGSITDAAGEDKASAAGRAKSGSTVVGLFGRKKATTVASPAKPKRPDNDSSDESPSSVFGSVVSEDDGVKTSTASSASSSASTGQWPLRLRRNTSADGPPVVVAKKSPVNNMVGVLKKRVGASGTKLTDSGGPSESSASSSASPVRGSEDETLSNSSTDSPRLPAGWTKHESRSNPGQYFFAHTSGATSWERPKEPEHEQEEDEPHTVESSDDEEVDSRAGSRADEHVGAAAKPKKAKKGWTFKLPRKLTIATSSSTAAPAPTPAVAAPTDAAASTAPIEHDASHHEF